MIILWGYKYTEQSNSFKVAAEALKQQYIDQGYSEEDILVTAISTDDQIKRRIEMQDHGEIEHLDILAHGWAIDSDGSIRGGITVANKGMIVDDGYVEEKSWLNGEDLEEDNWSDLAQYFHDDSEVSLYACNTAQGTFPQELANTLDTEVIAFEDSLKFFYATPWGFIPYNGDHKEFDDTPKYPVYMMPYIPFTSEPRYWKNPERFLPQ